MNSIIDRYIDSHQHRFCELADQIWDLAELKFAEHQSCKAHAVALEQAGFRVQRNLGGLPTALLGEYGSGEPVIALLGEYDALPGLSQTAGLPQADPLDPQGAGHGCGHHLLGCASLLAAIALKKAMTEGGLGGTLRYYGCPAEEGGSGKTYLVRAGAFDGVDAALTWHPDSFNGVSTFTNLANLQAFFRFQGRASHAAISPHLGRSALDAVELMNVGSNYLREHMPADTRLHYAITNSGGHSPSIVQHQAEVLYLLRGGEMNSVLDLFERVKNVAAGAALMTETRMSVQFDRATSSVLGNSTLEQVLQECLEEVGGARVDADDESQARLFRETFSEEEIASVYSDLGLTRDDRVLHQGVVPLAKQRQPIFASSDIGDVSRVIPTAQLYMACYAIGTAFHSWQMVAQGKSAFAHKGMLQTAKVLARAGLALMMDTARVTAAREEFSRLTANTPYRCPIPADISPPV
ncbi:MAG TPA: M20 family metallopeptidase [Pseudomonas sp.]|jgi:aminobenzoyl-glutamate utilization protein B|uniref:M20 family metallopeptidase n=1 Tax=Pseudomonas sp. TaxID=306 RepID=UPI002EDB6B48